MADENPGHGQPLVAWDVTFRRNRWVPAYKAEKVVIIAPDGDIQALLGNLQGDHEDVRIDKVELLGVGRVAF